MQLNKEYESEINLKDLFFHVLYRWRSILLVALIGAVLFGGYKYLSMNKAAKSMQVSQQEALPSEEEIALNLEIEKKAKQVADLEAYLSESVYINLNPQGIWTGSCKYLVKAEPSASGGPIDPADTILPVYSYPMSGASEDELKEVFDTDKHEHIDELVRTEINTVENSITVTVKGASVDSVQKVLEFIQTRMEAIKTKAQNINLHSLVHVGNEIVLLTEVKEQTDTLPNRRSYLASALSQYRSELQALRERAEIRRTHGQSVIKKSDIIKFALIGFAIGAFVMACFYAFHYALGGRVVNSSEISEKYNLPILEESVRSSSIHNNRGLDKLLAKWEVGKNKTDTEKMYNNISALIAEQQEAKDVLLVSTLKTDKLKTIKEALATRIDDKTIEAKGNFLTDSEAITEAAKAAAVILVEQKDTSRIKDIERMAESLMISQANVIGAIVL